MIAALKFQPLQDSDINVTDDVVSSDESPEPMSLVVKPIEKSYQEDRKRKATNLCWNGFKKIRTFYSAPVTKFSANLVSFTCLNLSTEFNIVNHIVL